MAKNRKIVGHYSFYCGVALALGAVARHGQPAIAVDTMDQFGLSLADLIAAGAEEYDLAPLRDEYKLQWRKLDGTKKMWGRKKVEKSS